MKVVNTVQNILLALLLVAIAFIALDGLLQIFEVENDTPAIDVIQTGAEFLRFDALETVFVDQGPVATMVLGLLAYTLIGGLVLLLFWAIRTFIWAWRLSG